MKLSANGKSYTIHPEHLNDLPQTPWAAAIREWLKAGKIRISTSGSTGKPKLITLNSELIQWSANSTSKALDLDKENVLVCIPIDKIGGRMLLIRSLIFDWDCTLVEPSADPLVEIPGDHHFTFVSLVPYQVGMILKSPDSIQKLLRFRTVLIGGGEISKAVENQLLSYLNVNTKFYHSYGMTETASHVALRELGTDFFTLSDGVESKINSNECLTIYIAEIDLRVQTNDVVKLKGRNLRFHSRVDDVINSGGVKLNLVDIQNEITKTLANHGLKSEFFLWKLPDDLLGEKLVFIGIQTVKSVHIEDIIQNEFSGYEKPRLFLWTDQFDRTSTGKILREETLRRLIEIGS